MKILVFGSFNIDKVYTLPHLPARGETLYCENYEVHVGGKGLNQALALKKAGANVVVAGKVGADGAFLTGYLAENGIDISEIDNSGEYTGHTIIEVGKPEDVILEVADSFQCDAVVVGRPDRSRFDRMVMGSVSQDLVENSKCPVIIVPTPGEED